MSCDAILGAVITLISGIVGFIAQTIAGSIKDGRNKRHELLLKTYEQKITAYKQLNKWLVSIESKIYNPEKMIKDVSESDSLDFPIFDEFNELWNAYLDNEMFFNNEIKAVFASISSEIACVNKDIKEYNETKEDGYISIIKNEISHLYVNIMRCRSMIYKELNIDEMEKRIAK